MKHFVKQPEPSNLCGQSCVAMIAGITLDESIKVFGKRSGTYTKDVITALQKLNISCGDKLIRISKTQKKSDFCMVVVRAKKFKRYDHWVVFKDGQYYDPAIGIANDLNGDFHDPIAYKLQWYEFERHETSYLPIN